MSKTILVFFCLVIAGSAGAQYKNDNHLFKTVYPEELCKEMTKNPGALFLDVRSAGEFNDTSASTGLNIGHIKNAINMDVRQLPQQWHSLEAYKSKPVFVYCSHSQRSRRASKMLADSGFTNVINVNGGMTAIRALTNDRLPCQLSLLESKNKYAVISPANLCQMLREHSKNYTLLDVRPDSAWLHISSNAKVNAMGSFKSAKHIALDQLAMHVDDLPVNKVIIVTDNFGGDAARAANMLVDKGFQKVSVLLEGMDRWLATTTDDNSCNDLYRPAVSYSIVGSVAFGKMINDKTSNLILDVRPLDEFSNHSKDYYKNIGHLKNAVNIPQAELNDRVKEILEYRDQPVYVYAFSGSPEAYSAANLLSEKGFTNIKVLAGGLFNLRWTAANVTGMRHLEAWVTDIPDENK